MIYLKITNQKEFNSHDVSYRLTTCCGAFRGDVEIDGKTISGDHGADDYLEYGFQICNKDWRDIIRESRQENGISQKELAEKIGVWQKDISNYERGIHDFGSTTIQKIIDALGNITINLSPGSFEV